MPVEIRELVIRARLNSENEPGSGNNAVVQAKTNGDEVAEVTTSFELSKEETRRIVALCMRQIKEAMAAQQLR
jgi:Family of unknown function (DUF5908)